MLPVQTDVEALLKGCLRREPTAQRQLVRRYAASLLSVARRYTRNTAEAEDVLQDALLLIFEKINTYNPQRGSLEGWMRRVVINAALGNRRRFAFTREQSYDSPPDSQDFAPGVLEQIGFEELLALVNELPDGAREVFNLAVFDDFSHDEIAEKLGIAAGTSRSLLSRARKLLQDKLQRLQRHELASI